MNFKRILFIVGELPRLFRLLKEVWKIFSNASDDKVIELLEDVDRVTDTLKTAKTHDERAEAATRISGLLKRM